MASSRSPSASTTSSFKVDKPEAQWAKELDPSRYRILRQQGTEPPHSSEFNNMYPSQGYFKCAGCGHPLYTAGSKFKSSCGWPCFDQVVYSEEGGCHVGVRPHRGQFEIICNNCGGHLGHVFYGEKCTANNERH
uniref:MsrB domain-containing protein n=1 Tax=Zooxanthella nutricula TaxID=1333877 RepID=A0A7S2LL43_9DINO